MGNTLVTAIIHTVALIPVLVGAVALGVYVSPLLRGKAAYQGRHWVTV